MAPAIIHMDERAPHNHIAWAPFITRVSRVGFTSGASRWEFRRAMLARVERHSRHSAVYVAFSTCCTFLRSSGTAKTVVGGVDQQDMAATTRPTFLTSQVPIILHLLECIGPKFEQPTWRLTHLHGEGPGHAQQMLDRFY